VNEAKYIAVMVRELLLKQVEDSIGIVAFSQEQQSVITEALDELTGLDKNFDAALEKAYNRKDDGQFTGLFVKNLENVQGDERDIIIMSVCYGHDRQRKMIMNFGPINRKGGEKRLNVIFSRAKKHMAVISSIKHHHITNDYNEGPGYLKRFLHYAEMISMGNVEQARLILDSLVAGDLWKKEQAASVFSVVTAQMKAALEAEGYVVGEAIGQSSFKCSLAVKKHATDTQYSLGIMVDDDLHYQNSDVIEQYYQRPATLEAFGWKIAHVYAKDWLEDRAGVLKMILQELEHKAAAETAALPSKPQQQALDNPGTTILLSAAGDRFWEIARAGNRISMRFGKTGTKGQMQIRTYLNEAEVTVAMEQLIADQLKQGFVPASAHT
jgi:predicted DNA-binding WGR domain protein